MSNEANGGMSRVEALEKVVSETRSMLYGAPGAFERVSAALAALDALPAAPEPARGEVVEVAVWEYPDGEIRQARAGSNMDRHYHAVKPWTRLGTTRLPLVKGGGA
jgi:hypothetical protein